MKTITLGELLTKCGDDPIVMAPHKDGFAVWAAVQAPVTGPTPEDALQALAEAICGPDVVLVIPISARGIKLACEQAREMLEDRSKLWREKRGWFIDEFAAIDPGKAEAVWLELQDRFPQLIARSVLLPKGALDDSDTLAAAETRPVDDNGNNIITLFEQFGEAHPEAEVVLTGIEDRVLFELNLNGVWLGGLHLPLLRARQQSGLEEAQRVLAEWEVLLALAAAETCPCETSHEEEGETPCSH